MTGHFPSCLSPLQTWLWQMLNSVTLHQLHLCLVSLYLSLVLQSPLVSPDIEGTCDEPAQRYSKKVLFTVTCLSDYNLKSSNYITVTNHSNTALLWQFKGQTACCVTGVWWSADDNFLCKKKVCFYKKKRNMLLKISFVNNLAIPKVFCVLFREVSKLAKTGKKKKIFDTVTINSLLKHQHGISG